MIDMINVTFEYLGIKARCFSYQSYLAIKAIYCIALQPITMSGQRSR